jgi:membrane associated rhomboid family serine protease
MSVIRDFRRSAAASGAPGTVVLVILLIAFYLLAFLNLAPVTELAFWTSEALARPWTFLTYAFVTDARWLIAIVFMCLWLWGIGGWVERDLGTPKYLMVFCLFAVLCSLALFIGAMVVGRHTVLMSAWTPIAALTIIWGTRNPEMGVTLMFVLPIKGKYLAWLSAALVFFGTADPRLAIFAAAPLALAYFFAANKLAALPYARGAPSFSLPRKQEGKHPREDDRYFDDVKRREKEREERERLRKLFEGSLSDDDDPEAGSRPR